MVRTGKANQAKRFSFLTAQLTRWRSAVQAAGTISTDHKILSVGIVSAKMVAVLVAVGLWVRGAARRAESGSAFLDLTDNT
jgi:hypothetical protein